MIDGLYNTDILTLAAGLSNGRLADPDGSARKVSKLCGSWLEIDLNVEYARVSACALRVQACALGQASAGILQAKIIGATCAEIYEARDALYKILKEGGPAPAGRFEALSVLAGVRDYPARHTSTMLSFEAASAALDGLC